MTFEEACKTIDRASHPHMLFLLENQEYPPEGLWRLRIHHKTVDSETLKPIILVRIKTISAARHISPENLLNFLWRAVRDAFVHEADEFFKVDGVALHHPHHEKI